jgi:hypothetical protein
MSNQRTSFSRISRHPAVVALFSVVLGTWLFGQYDYWQKSRDSRREKSVAFLEETSRNFNNVLTDIYLSTQNKTPADDSLRKSGNNLFKQRFVVAIKSEAFLQSSTFARDYYNIVREMEKLIDLLSEPDPQYDQIKLRTDQAWRDAQGLLSKALSDAMRQANSDLASTLFLPGTVGMILLLVVGLSIPALLFWQGRKSSPDHKQQTQTTKTS